MSCPVEEVMDDLSDVDAAAVLAGMQKARDERGRAARRLDGDI